MKILQQASLVPYNTFGIDAKADYLICYHSVEELREVLQLDIVHTNKLLHVGLGSNLLFLNDFSGVILHSEIRFIKSVGDDANQIFIEAGAGVVWDDFVDFCVARGLSGSENLSLIPGEVGAAAVQNIGAYGVEVCDLIKEVHAIEIVTGATRIFTKDECAYGYRESIFKNELKGRYILTSVVFALNKTPKFELGYQHLEEEVRKQGEISLKTIRSTIIAIRESKLPDPKVTGNAGSFFKNPVISKVQFLELQKLYPTIPHYFVSENEEKVPAGWLIDQCGWKGRSMGNAGVHDKQALVLINKGGAGGSDIVNLAQQIQESVKQKYGIELHPEVNYID